jgi:DMSO/TMAO reductase YedYZ molybdopterin-dependent catalytic subunit
MHSRPITRIPVIASVLLVLALAPAIGGCTAPRTAGGALPAVEVRQYHGQRLDPINALHQNTIKDTIKGTQYLDLKTYRLHVYGLVSKPATYTYDAVLSGEATYTKVVRLDCVEGWSATILWEGILLSDVIDRSQPSADATTVVFHGADGYTTSLPLSFIRSHKILLAYKMDGVTIPPEQGFPFMVVAEDHWGYKWAKWVTGIELSTDPKYLGYWEQRGYSQSGLRSQNMFSTP